jgi:DNA polymerase-3 subunit alpha
LGLVQVATFGTEGTKQAILTACRGYRSDECPDGIEVDEAQYMSSLIPQERGFLWPIHDVIYGNEEKDRKPVTTFIKEVKQYKGLLEIIEYIEGIINKRSSHASGVILYGDDPYETASFMRTPSGDLITCYDLHKAESAGDTKYDFLVTEASDKIITCYQLLKKDKQISPVDLTLREFYNKYLHPEVIDTTDQRIWDHLAAGDVLDVFQFSTGVGLAIAKRLKPQDPMEMTAANAMMRLMSEKGKESQQDRYYRIQHSGIKVFDDEMRAQHLPEDLITKMHKHCDKYYGCCPIQEQMMEILMDVASFTLGEANSARKIVAKKQMSKIPQLKEQVFSKFDNENNAEYFWEVAIAPQLGYAFSLNHSLPYSFVAIQMIYLVIHFNPIYWDTACLIVNSGSLEDNQEEEIVDIYAPEGDDLANGVTFEDLPDRSGKIRRASATDYGKIAKAISDIQKAGIDVGLPDINKSKFGFAPDIENNKILFGLKGMLNVGDELVNKIISNRPYISPKDFLMRIQPTKQAMISLIKGGAFDTMFDRKELMVWYIWETCDKKKRITLQNMNGLIKHQLLPENTEEQIMARRVFEFNRYLKAICKSKQISGIYCLDERALNFLHELNEEKDIQVAEGAYFLTEKAWDKVYQKWMDIFRSWIAENKDNILYNLNTLIFREDWEKYAGKANLSAWEMEVLCYYYHAHELTNVNVGKYGFVDFFSLPEEPIVDRSFTKGNHTIHIYKLFKICGTCIAKNKTKSTVTILTTSGPVEVKFRKEYFSLFDKQISQRQPDGTKKIVEKSWFNRGNMIVVMGVRNGDNFLSKKYSSSSSHQLYRIKNLKPNGDLELTNARYQGDIEEDV